MPSPVKAPIKTGTTTTKAAPPVVEEAAPQPQIYPDVQSTSQLLSPTLPQTTKQTGCPKCGNQHLAKYGAVSRCICGWSGVT